MLQPSAKLIAPLKTLSCIATMLLATTNTAWAVSDAHKQAKSTSQHSTQADLRGINKLPAVQNFIARMTQQHGFKKSDLNSLFSKIEFQEEIVQAMTHPYEKVEWYKYKLHFLNDKRISGGVAFWQQHQQDLARAEKQFGVPASIIVAIIGVESHYGQIQGKFPVMHALSTLAFDFPKREKFFQNELAEYLLFAREEKIDPLSIKGSYAGAIGQPQFMPSSYRHYAVAFAGGSRRDLVNNSVDVIGSVANYLSKNGWQRNSPVAIPAKVSSKQWTALKLNAVKPQYTLQQLAEYGVAPGASTNHLAHSIPASMLSFEEKDHMAPWIGFHNFYVITRYNTSPLYAMAVYQLSQRIAEQHSSRLAANKQHKDA